MYRLIGNYVAETIPIESMWGLIIVTDAMKGSLITNGPIPTVADVTIMITNATRDSAHLITCDSNPKSSFDRVHEHARHNLCGFPGKFVAKCTWLS